MSAQNTPGPLPRMWIDSAKRGVIRFGEPDGMAGMVAGVIAADVVRACNAHDELVAALMAWRHFSGCCLHESVFASPAFIAARELTSAALAKAGVA